jgi:hypothetical protein
MITIDKRRKLNNTICIVFGALYVVMTIIYFALPRLEFREEIYNNCYRFSFFILSIILFFNLFFIIYRIKQLKYSLGLYFINGVLFLGSIFIAPLIIFGADPEVDQYEFFDDKILYVNPENKNDKIIAQHSFDWKTREEQYWNNHVIEYGVLRYYKEYKLVGKEFDKK